VRKKGLGVATVRGGERGVERRRWCGNREWREEKKMLREKEKNCDSSNKNIILLLDSSVLYKIYCIIKLLL
jgi:hypothetical protein